MTGARKIASTAAYAGSIGAAGLAGVGLGAYGLLRIEAMIARRVVGQPFEGAPEDSGTYGHAPGAPVELLVVGDSTAKGMGADRSTQTVGAIVATAVAAIAGRPVHLTNVASVGAISTDLGAQVERALELVDRPHVALIMIGANDVTRSVQRATSIRHLAAAVAALRAVGCEVVVGTCPDLGVIEPVPQPLRFLTRKWSRDLAAAQTVAVVEHGGRTVSLGDLLGHEFEQTPSVMFSKDRFHPSAAGYARAASALIPSVLDALGQASTDTGRAPDRRRGESIGPVSVAAMRAVRDPGTEVSATAIGGQESGHRGRWAVLLRRHHEPLPAAVEPPAPDASVTGMSDHETPVTSDVTES
ncbi:MULTISPECIES: SGNH/GDSL hydrolase family protein [Yimella]|uniref:Lysophospholipase L1-like esterase n=1 Tax=Yimella lutea TaxID=587872 RepID=A0A542EK51_9MICO|nr:MULTISPECIES: SGNH/GDSL hydrolase family protein [Yimella]MCG8654470.1 SGNH/GDSL hydrolase family protein [Yimella sp. NH-Cas1]RYG78129.1 SGNH/GDSL hydrolase family protein [Yimella sp. RIT 621]TQJ15719.1 lysophospholipase L1-like esterase [Yimella lutea]